MKTLKLGSTGPDVERLQAYLKISVDGDFGPKTEKAVKEWQKKFGLLDDGVVGPKTANAMGLIDSDIEELSKPNSELIIKQHFLPKGQFIAGPTKKEWLFLHHTAGWDNPYQTIDIWGRDTQGAIATEFVLGGPKLTDASTRYDGELVQAFPAGGYGWHLGTGNSSMHRNSVGIEVCNFGYLTKGGYWKYDRTTKRNVWVPLEANSYYTYTGAKAHSSQITVLSKAFRNYTHWHKYSDAQIETLKDWILFIANRDSIDVRKGLIELIKKRGAHAAFDHFSVADCTNVKGMWSHTNCRKDKVDMFPQDELVEMLLSI